MSNIFAARTIACKKVPYLQQSIMGLNLVEEPSVMTAGVDSKGNFYYNPEFLHKLNHEQAATLVLHEGLHKDLRHCFRRGNREPKLWNVAIDLVVNQACIDSGMEPIPQMTDLVMDMKPFGEVQVTGMFILPADFGYPPNETAEMYYNRLNEQFPKDKDDEDGDSQGDAALDKLLKKWGKKGEHGEPIGGGSGQDGIPREWETQDSVLTELEQQQRTENFHKAVHQWAKDKGNAPAGLVREVGDAVVRENSADKILRKLKKFGQAIKGNEETTYSRLPRRRMPGIITPGERAYKPRLLIIADTSGSMGPDDLQKSLSFIQYCLHLYGEVFLITGDTQAETACKVFSKDEVQFVGGGGTDMAGIMRDANEKYEADAMIVVTDGYTGWCDEGELSIPAFVMCTTRESWPSYYDGCYLTEERG